MEAEGGEAPATAEAAVSVCDNCARAADDLASVRRVYVVPEAWDTAGSQTTLDDVERWCMSCRSQYPHEAVDAEPAE